MNWFKYILPRVFAVVCVTILSAFIYKKVYWVPELKDQGPMLYNLLEYQWHNDVLYFGESSNFWTSPEDDDHRFISQMINDSLANARLSSLQMSAYHAGMFLPIVNLIDANSKVKHIVITMNLRSFDQAWIYSTLEDELLRAKCFYEDKPPMFNRLCATLGYYPQPTAQQQNAKMLNCFEFDSLNSNCRPPFSNIKTWCEQEKFPLPNGGEDFPKRELADHYIKAYAFQIDTLNNVRIKDFDEIVSICRNKNIRLYFNILSENTQWADSLVGPELVCLMRENKNLLMERYSRMGVEMIDNLESVPGYCFGEKNWTTEHYNQTGRKIIARNVLKALVKYISQKK